MARRKRGAALFDVIHQDARFGAKPLPGPGKGWRSWFGKRRSEGAADMGLATPPAPVSSPRMPRILLRDRMAGLLHRLAPLLPRFGLKVDEERGVVGFQLSYTAALVTLAGVLMLGLVGYVIGRHGTRHVLPALAEQTTDELRAGPAHPEVLDVGPASDAQAAGAQAMGDDALGAAHGAITASAHDGLSAKSPPPPAHPSPMPPNLDANRTVGLNYVIIQSYPPAEKKLAEDAKDLLNRNGVLCTIETDIPYAPRWLSLVGVMGFPRIKDSPQYDAYVAHIEQIGEQFGKNSRFKRFEPRPFKWREGK